MTSDPFEDGDFTEREPTRAIEVFASTEMATAQIRGEVDIQIATAKKFPRSISKFRQEAQAMACLDRATAEECRYALPRGGKKIEGPSSRFAELVGVAWGNLRVASRVVGVDATHVTVQGVAFDLERNYARSSEVRRRITNRNNERYNDDMITVTANAAASIAERNAVLRTVPKAYWAPVYEKALEVARKTNRTVEEQRVDALSFFAKHGVKEDRVLAVIGKRKREDIDMEDLDTLRGLATALKEGTTTVEESFPLPNGVKSSGTLPDLESALKVKIPEREAGGDEPEDTDVNQR